MTSDEPGLPVQENDSDGADDAVECPHCEGDVEPCLVAVGVVEAVHDVPPETVESEDCKTDVEEEEDLVEISSQGQHRKDKSDE